MSEDDHVANDPSPTSPPPPPAREAEVTVEPTTSKEANMWAMLCHLSALLGLFFPVAGHIGGPLVVWLLKKDEIPAVNHHGKAALNFQLSFLIWTTVVGVVGAALCFVIIGFILLPVALFVIYLVLLIFPILAGVKANEGGWYDYPMTLRLVQ